jgi:Probable cobalt transporter subunit (CbtA)
MALFRNIVFAAALAGLIAGVFVTVVHKIGTVPIILKAETYEKAAEANPAPAAGVDAATAEHHHDAEAWEPADGFERTAFTVLADVLTGIAFGLLLTAAYALRGRAMDWRQGLFWGLAGFATFTLAPGLGLPPEVPGTESAPLLDSHGDRRRAGADLPHPQYRAGGARGGADRPAAHLRGAAAGRIQESRSGGLGAQLCRRRGGDEFLVLARFGIPHRSLLSMARRAVAGAPL